ncbi:threonylcarbamoyl-AMP synthase-like [Physella acuta]|uniref:threonylcarbamoyl-AMP synthase-like n=1 Tax=Physella acuta TaxID=109671 RepID=UPI0027DD2B71|nr:threonylcarbamoyl-AMP synthase-like [Physella acuta]
MLDGLKTKDVATASMMLLKGDVIAVPTDSVYALAASVKCPKSIDKIFDLKSRSREKNITLVLPSIQALEEADPIFHDRLWAYIKYCCPCSVGFVVPKGDWLDNICPKSKDLIGDKTSICIRIPNCTILSLLTLTSGPLVISSANIGGEPDSTSSSMVQQAFGNKIAGILCGGDSPQKKSSSIVNCLHFDSDQISYFRIEGTDQKKLFDDYQAAKLNVINRSITSILGTQNT